ncbi:MAG: hypothetical protein HPY50_01185 [Firmicutes bacterium]|nr:hypothetical protein [Bacillota bacterium]
MKKTDLVLPESYGVNRLIILPCDAKNLFAFWEISEEIWSGHEQFFLILNRLPDSHTEIEGPFINQVPLHARTGSLYLKVPSGASICAEITIAGLTSNTVLMPRPFGARPEVQLHVYALSP